MRIFISDQKRSNKGRILKTQNLILKAQTGSRKGKKGYTQV